MKSILISIKPKYVAKILNGEKTLEIRKTMPKCDLPIDVYIYCTKEDSLGRIKELPKDRYFVDCVETPQDFAKMDSGYDGKGKVVAKFTLDELTGYEINPNEINNPDDEDWEIAKASCLSFEETMKYANGNPIIAWHISNLEIFDRPKELSEFEYFFFYRDTIWGRQYELKNVTRAAQDWMYVEVD